MFQIQLAEVVRISSLFVCFLSIYAIPDDIKNAKSTAVTNVTEITENQQVQRPLKLEIKPSADSISIELDGTIPLTCSIEPAEDGEKIWWEKDGISLPNLGINHSNSTAMISIKMESVNNTGEYICVATRKNGIPINRTIDIKLIPEPGKIIGQHGAKVKLNGSGNLTCQLEGYPLTNFRWKKIGDRESGVDSRNLTTVNENTTHFTMILSFKSVNRQDNGSYECLANDHNTTIRSRCDLIVTEVPEVKIEFVKAVGIDKVYLNSTVKEWNDPVQSYFVEYKKRSSKKWESKTIENEPKRNFSYVLEGLETNADYDIRIGAENTVGKSPTAKPEWIVTLKEDPKFIPEISILEKENKSITIVWTGLPKDLQEYFHYYRIMTTNTEEIYKCPVEPVNIYKFQNLEFAVDSYGFRIAACSGYTMKCGNWSAEVKSTSPIHDFKRIELDFQQNALPCIY